MIFKNINLNKIPDINELINKLESDKKKLMLVLFAVCALLFMDFSFFISAQFRGIKNANTKIIKLKKDIDGLPKNLTTVKDNQTKQESSVKNKKVMSEGEIPLLLQDISALADKHKVKIMQIKPLKDSKAKEEIIGEKKFLSVNINLDLSCQYHYLGSFITALENSGVFIALQDIRITRSSNDYMSQDVDLTLKTYVKK